MGPALSPAAPAIALLGALEEEAPGLRRRLALAPERVAGVGPAYGGRYGRARVLLVLTGMGRRRAEAAAEAVLAGVDVRAVLSFGFSGGLQGHLAAGDLVLASELMGSRGPAGGEVEPTIYRADQGLLRAAAEALGAARLPAVRGPTLTAPGIIATPAGKERLGLRTGAVAVDMESYWIAKAAGERGLPFLAVRAISDAMDDPLPPLDRLLDDNGGPSGRRLAAHLLREPGSLVDLLRLGRNAGRARRALTAGVACAVAGLALAALDRREEGP